MAHMFARGALVACVLVLVLVPAVSAQNPAPQVTVSATAPSGRLMPEADRAAVPVVVRVGCNGQEGPGMATRVDWQMTSFPAYATAAFIPTSDSKTYAPEDCIPGRTKPFYTNLTVSTTREAPAFRDDEYRFRVTVHKPRAGGGTDAYPQGEAFILLKNDFLPVVRFQPSSTHAWTEPGRTATFSIAVENLGNGPVRVSIDASSIGSPPLQSVSDAELRLESTAQKGPEAAFKDYAEITAIPGDIEGLYRIRVAVNATYDGAGEATLFDVQDAEFALRVSRERTGVGDAPGLPFLLMPLAFAALAAWRRR